MDAEKKTVGQDEETLPSLVSFFRLREAHEAQEALFHQHQCCLVDRELDQALLLLKQYRAQILRHMRDEEEILLPLYEKGQILPGGQGNYFVQEHRKLLDFLDRIKDAMEVLALAEGDAWYRALFTVLDLETTFKNIGEHHEAREEKFLFPGLDALVPREARLGILKRCKSLAL